MPIYSPINSEIGLNLKEQPSKAQTINHKGKASDITVVNPLTFLVASQRDILSTVCK